MTRTFSLPEPLLFDERHGGEAVVASVDQTALQRFLLGPADLVQHPLEGGVVVAGVEVGLTLVRHELPGRERQFGLADQIPAAEFHRVEAEIAGHDVEQALAKEVRFEPSGGPKRADRRLARHQRFDGDGHVADAVGPGEELRGLGRHHSAVGADIGAHIAVDVAAQAEDDAVARARNLEVAVDLARVIGRHQMLAAILDPFDRAADMARRERDEKILGIELAAHAEAAADVELNHVDGMLGKPQHGREHATVEEQDLGGTENDEPPLRRIPFGDEAAGLQRNRGQAMTAKALAAGVLGLGESRLGVARRYRIPHRAIAAARFEQQRRAACRRMPVRQRRQRRDIDLDRFKRIFGQCLAVGHDHRDAARRRSAPCPWR